MDKTLPAESENTVRSLVREDSSCLRAAKAHTTATEPVYCSCWTLCSSAREASAVRQTVALTDHSRERPHTAMKMQHNQKKKKKQQLTKRKNLKVYKILT